MNELSRTDEDRLSFELDEGFKKWQMEQAIASFDEFGITLPLDTSSAAWRKDYAHRTKPGMYRTRRSAATSMAIPLILGAVMWTPILFYFWRKPILKFFGVE